MDDHELAGWLAARAGALLMPLRDGPLERGALGFVGDQAANAFLMASLKMLRPDDHILSEESPDAQARLGASRVWIIDPLDGTREYAEGRSDWAVHVALTIDGSPAAGAVAQPDLGRTLTTAGVAPAPRPQRRPIMVVSRTRPPQGAQELAAALGADIQPMGSAGAKAAAVIAGEADVYYHAGGQHEWDNCAPVAVALAAGLTACRADGSAIRYNRPDVKVPDLLIAEPALAAAALQFLARHRAPL
jgi:3'(2'), 5'-bisphosphate nucleotidase